MPEVEEIRESLGEVADFAYEHINELGIRNSVSQLWRAAYKIKAVYPGLTAEVTLGLIQTWFIDTVPDVLESTKMLQREAMIQFTSELKSAESEIAEMLNKMKDL